MVMSTEVPLPYSDEISIRPLCWFRISCAMDRPRPVPPDCGHMMYGQITQIDYGSTDFSTYVAKRVPKFVLDQPNDRRKLRLAARPLAAPKNYCPYIYAANVVA